MGKEKYEIVFVFPPSPYGRFFKCHLGVGYVQAYLEERGTPSIQYTTAKHMNVETLVKELVNLSSNIIGFTCYDSNYYNVRILANQIKNKKPDTLIIAGGPTATFSDEFILNDCLGMDVCVRGEGEQTVYELLMASDIHRIRGLTFRNKNEIVITPDRPLIHGGTKGAELDVLPSPYRTELVPLDGQCGVTTSRGCVQACTYCNCGVMFGHTVRFHSPERVLAELEKICSFAESTKQASEKPSVNINDDAFSVNVERAKKICEGIIRKGLRLNLSCETRADRCDEELLELMFQAGFKQINFGLESAVPQILRNVKKVSESSDQNLKSEEEFLIKLKHNVAFAKKIGLLPTVSIISGLPGETLEDANKTIRFVDKLHLADYAHNFLTIYNGTELFSTFSKWGLGISEPPYKLPYETVYAYDVTRLSELPNAMHTPFLVQEEKKFLALLLGTFSSPTDRCFSDVFFQSSPKIDDEFRNELSKVISMPSSIYDIGKNLSTAKAKSKRDRLLSQGVPIGRYFYTEHLPLTQTFEYMRLIRLDISWKPTYNILIIPFSESKNIKKLQLDQNFRVIYSLRSIEDSVRFKRFMEESFETRRAGSSEGPKGPFFGFVDVCRWSSARCPVTMLSRIIVRGNCFLPCWNAHPIGELGDTPEDIMVKVRRRYQEEQRRRGCKSCEVKDNCSKCLFTKPFEVDEYCRLRRTYPRISDLALLLKRLRFTFS